MKLLNKVNEKAAAKSTPYTPEEIDAHENAGRIWATIAECKREAQEAGRQSWDDGYWSGVHDRDISKT